MENPLRGDTASDAAAGARTHFNSMVLSRLQAELKDPAVDLTDFLRGLADVYPDRCATLAKGAQRRATAALTTAANHSATAAPAKDASRTATSHISAGALPPNLLIKDNVRVVHPVEEERLVLAGVLEKGATRATDAQMATMINAALRRGSVLWELNDLHVLALGSSAVVKIGASLDANEAENLAHINKNAPDLPAPRCLGAIASQGRSYLFMTRAEGTTLETVWPQLSAAQKRSVQAQLDAIFRALRAQPFVAASPHSKAPIGSFASGTCRDQRRMPRISDRKHLTEAAFNDFLCSGPRRTHSPWIQMVRSAMRDDHRIVWTHGDLHPRNIMVEWEAEPGPNTDAAEQGIRVTSLIDWETAGWYPEYWEFCKALMTVGRRGPLSDWYCFLPQAIGQWPVEYALDCMIDRWLG